MKQISLWAKYHKTSARIIIVFSSLLLLIGGTITGSLLKDLNIILPKELLFAIALIYLIALIYYPVKSIKRKLTGHNFYVRQKKMDCVLIASSFLLMACISNDGFKPLNAINIFQPAAASLPSTPGDSLTTKYKSITAFSASLKDANGNSLKWKEKKKQLLHQVKAIRKADELSEGAKIALIILSVIVALGLLALVASLACSISCSGSGAGAILVGVGGTALVVFLLVIAIRAINGKKKMKAEKQAVPSET